MLLVYTNGMLHQVAKPDSEIASVNQTVTRVGYEVKADIVSLVLDLHLRSLVASISTMIFWLRLSSIHPRHQGSLHMISTAIESVRPCIMINFLVDFNYTKALADCQSGFAGSHLMKEI